MLTSKPLETFRMCIECGADDRHSSLRIGPSSTALQALRMVLITAMDRELAAGCMGMASGDAVTLWPSGIYARLARGALDSPMVWRRCGALLDTTFGEFSRRFEGLSPIEVSQRFYEGRSARSVFELSAMIWALLRRSQRSLDRLIHRMGAELEVVAIDRAAEANDDRRLSLGPHGERPVTTELNSSSFRQHYSPEP